MKIFKLVALSTIFFLLLPHFSLAQFGRPDEFSEPEIPTKLFSCYPTDTLRRCMLRLLGDALRVILVIALAFAAIIIAWAGIEYILKGGAKEEERTKVKNRLIYAAVGLVVAFLAWVITAMLTRIIGGAAI